MPKKVKLPASEVIPIRIADAYEPFFEYLTSQGMEKSTQNGYKTTFNRVIEAAGPKTYFFEITPAHITAVFAALAANGKAYKKNGQGSRNNTISHLRGIWEWGRINEYVHPFDTKWPINAWKRQAYEIEQPPYVPAKEWPALLAAADRFHPIYRITAALGLYLLARGPSELGTLRLWDLDLHNWTVTITRDKTKMAGDDIPICGELREELIRWLGIYNAWALKNRGSEVQRDWYLLPRSNYSRAGLEHYKLFPELHRAANTIANQATEICKAYGSPGRGSHYFRKSGGRALYNALRETGQSRDFALDIVRSMYGHKSRTMTEYYLNLQLDREVRDEAVVQYGGYMYPWNDPAQNVPTPISVKQVPGSLVGGVLLGGTSKGRLAAVERAAESLPGFLRQVA